MRRRRPQKEHRHCLQDSQLRRKNHQRNLSAISRRSNAPHHWSRRRAPADHHHRTLLLGVWGFISPPSEMTAKTPGTRAARGLFILSKKLPWYVRFTNLSTFGASGLRIRGDISNFDMGKNISKFTIAGPRGFEPRSTVLETAILPLNYRPCRRYSTITLRKRKRPQRGIFTS